MTTECHKSTARTWVPLSILVILTFFYLSIYMTATPQFTLRHICIELKEEPHCATVEALHLAAQFGIISTIYPGIALIIFVGVLGAFSNRLGRRSTLSIALTGQIFMVLGRILINFFPHAFRNTWRFWVTVGNMIQAICGGVLILHMAIFGVLGDISTHNPSFRMSLFVIFDLLGAIGAIAGAQAAGILMDYDEKYLLTIVAFGLVFNIAIVVFIIPESIDPALRELPIELKNANTVGQLSFLVPVGFTRRILEDDAEMIYLKIHGLWQEQQRRIYEQRKWFKRQQLQLQQKMQNNNQQLQQKMQNNDNQITSNTNNTTIYSSSLPTDINDIIASNRFGSNFQGGGYSLDMKEDDHCGDGDEKKEDVGDTDENDLDGLESPPIPSPFSPQQQLGQKIPKVTDESRDDSKVPNPEQNHNSNQEQTTSSPVPNPPQSSTAGPSDAGFGDERYTLINYSAFGGESEDFQYQFNNNTTNLLGSYSIDDQNDLLFGSISIGSSNELLFGSFMKPSDGGNARIGNHLSNLEDIDDIDDIDEIVHAPSHHIHLHRKANNSNKANNSPPQSFDQHFNKNGDMVDHRGVPYLKLSQPPRLIQHGNSMMMLTLCLFLFMMNFVGYNIVSLYYLKKMFDISSHQFSNLESITDISRVLGSLVMFPLIQKYVKSATGGKKCLIGFVVLQALAFFLLYFCTSYYQFVGMAIIYYLAVTYPQAIIRSLMTNQVSQRLQQHVLSSLAATQVCALVLSSVGTHFFWMKTQKLNPHIMIWAWFIVSICSAIMPFLIKDTDEDFDLRVEMTTQYTIITTAEQEYEEEQRLKTIKQKIIHDVEIDDDFVIVELVDQVTQKDRMELQVDVE